MLSLGLKKKNEVEIVFNIDMVFIKRYYRKNNVDKGLFNMKIIRD